MKESVGYTVTLNIAIIFIIIVFTFLSSAIIYFKSNKVSNIVMNSIEKYEGYNRYAVDEIKKKMDSLGYSGRDIKCESVIDKKNEACFLQASTNSSDSSLAQSALGYNIYVLGSAIVSIDSAITLMKSYDTSQYAADGYCVYVCVDRNKTYDSNEGFDFYYKVRTNMMMNIPIINEILDIPIYSNTNDMHYFNF